MPDEKIVEKLKKLKAHAEGAKKIGSEREAQSFMAKLYELMAEHGVEEHHLEEKDIPIIFTYFMPEHEGLEVKTKSQTPAWLALLAKHIGTACSCATAATRGENWVRIQGRGHDVKQCHNALRYLSLAAMRLAMRSYRKLLTELKAKGVINTVRYTKNYKESFLIAFVTRIYERLAEERAKIAATNETGLMILDQKLVKAQESMAQAPGMQDKRYDLDDANNPYGLADGVEAADKQQLRPAGELN